MDTSELEPRQARARAWFETLRDRICEAFETLEREAPAALYPDPPAGFVRTPWPRTDSSGRPGGGGVVGAAPVLLKISERGQRLQERLHAR